MQERVLERILLNLRRRFVWIGSVAGLGWGLAAGLGCLLFGAWLDLIVGISPELRIATLVLTAAAGVVILALVVRSFVRGSAAPVLANRLDAVAGTGGQIRSGFDLFGANRRVSDSANPTLTGELADLAVSQAATLAGAVAPAQAVPLDPARKSAIVFASLAAVPAVLAVFLPRLVATEWGRFLDPYGDHPRYTSLQLQVEPQGARVVYGDGIDIHVTASGGVAEEVELVLEPLDGTADAEPEVLPMFPESPHRWRASISDVTVPLNYFVRARDTRSRRYRIDVITVPNIEGVRFRVVGPDYARIPVYEGALPQNGLSGLPGTRVEMTVRSNRPLSGGTATFLSDSGEQTVKLKSAGNQSREVRGELVVGEQGRFSIGVVDVADQSSIEPFVAPFTLLSDERPFVRLVQPPAVSFATPTAVVPVVIAAEDDFGISRLQLYRSLNDSRYLPLDLPLASPPPVRAHEVVPLPLSEYGLEPGDEIKLFARVEDNDPGGNADSDSASGRTVGKGSESSVVLIRIISQEEFDRMRRSREGMQMLASKYQQARRRLEQLSSELEEMQKKLDERPPGEQISADDRKALEQLAKRLQEEAEALQKLSEQSLPYDLDKELSPQLQKQAEALQKLAERMQKLSAGKPSNGAMSQALKEMQEALSQQRQQHDRDAMQPLELLQQILPLMKDQSRFVQLYQQQRELSDRLESLKELEDTDDPAVKARMRELETEQVRLREALNQLVDDIEEHADALPDDPRLDKLRTTAREFVQAVRASGAGEAMEGAEQGLAEFNGKEGHAEAKRAADILESLIAKCNGVGQACENCLPAFSPKLSSCLSQTLSQLMADAGFQQKMGNGLGRGAGGGYSSQRSTMQNVGLYGAEPLLEESQAARSGDSQSSPTSGTGAGFRQQNEQDLTTYGAGEGLRASGAGDAVVPLPYRRKVGRYFQRLADEVGEQ